MIPKMTAAAARLLVGKKLIMSLINNKTTILWKSFMPEQRTITGKVNNDLVSATIYPPGYFEHFNPQNEFEKWAAVEVGDPGNNIPGNMELFVVPGGLYAVFDYKGPAGDSAVYEYIFGTWLPASGYILDGRPHLEIMGAKYSNSSPASEEEIWVPVKIGY